MEGLQSVESDVENVGDGGGTTKRARCRLSASERTLLRDTPVPAFSGAGVADLRSPEQKAHMGKMNDESSIKEVP
jgi:hypothetical protein